MGWLRYLFLGDLGQQLDISDQRDEIASLKYQMSQQQPSGSSSTHLQSEIDHLQLTVSALAKVLINKRILSDSELNDMIQKIDAADGSVDGRMSK